MMTAKEARNFTEKLNLEKFEKEMEKIKESVEKDVKSGKFNSDIYFNISKETISEIERLGYGVEVVTTGPNENCYRISW